MLNDKRVNEVLVNNTSEPYVKMPQESVFLIKIQNNNKNYFGTGFLIEFTRNNEPLYCLMTCEHVVEKQILESKCSMELIYNKELKLEIELDKNKRNIQDFNFINIDAIVIEINEKKFIEKNHFLLPNKNYLNSYSQFKNRKIKIFQYPKGSDQLKCSKGEIKEVDEFIFEFSHKANTEKGSSGSPIFLSTDETVLGIHKQGSETKKENYGSFIGPIVDFFNNNLEYVKNENYEGGIREGKKEGYGKYKEENGEIYEGEWKNDKKNGKGRTFYAKDKKLKYEGDFVDNKFEGNGKFIWENGNYYIGPFRNGHKHGKGDLYTKDDNKIKEIYYENDKQIEIKIKEINEIKKVKNDNIYCLSNENIIIKEKYSKQNKKRCNNAESRKIIIFVIIICIILLIAAIIVSIFSSLKCEKGEGDKCLSCKKMSTRCKSCNLGYELFKGYCFTYFFKVIYKTSYNEILTLFNSSFIKYLLIMKIDNEILEPLIEYFFENEGVHEVYFYFSKSELKSLSYMFKNIKLQEISFNPDIDASNIIEMNYMFYNNIFLTAVNISNIYAPILRSVKGLFSGSSNLISVDLSNVNAPKLQIMREMFYGCVSLEYINFSNFNTKNVIDMNYVFGECSSLISLDLSDFNTQNVNDMNSMFSGCESLEYINISSFNTKNTRYMSDMFSFCESLTSIDLSNFNTENVEDMALMFSYCGSLTCIDLSSFDTKKVNDMNYMFLYCKSLTSIDDGFCDALLQLGAGGARHGDGRPRGDAQVEGPVPPLLRRLPHLPRGPEDRGAPAGRHPQDDQRRLRRRLPPPRPRPRASHDARHGVEPRRHLPAPRSRQQVLRGRARDRPEVHGPARRAHRPQVQALRLCRRARRRIRRRRDGLRLRHAPRDRRRPRQGR